MRFLFLLLTTTLPTSHSYGFNPITNTNTLTNRRASTSCLSAVEKKSSYSITLLKGDGIGPEIADATIVALSALEKKCNFKLNFTPALIGGAALDATDDAFPDESLAACIAGDSVLLACIGGYKWDNNSRDKRPETGLLKVSDE